MRLLNHVLEVSLRSRHNWSHFKIHRYECYRHLVWGKLSVTFGQPHLTPVRVCAHCYEEIQGISAGDEGWDFCEGCQQVEGETITITTEEYEAHHG